MAGTMLFIPTMDKAKSKKQKGLYLNLAFCPLSVKQGRWWTPVTSMFVHSNRTHLTNNVLSLATEADVTIEHSKLRDSFICFIGGGLLPCLPGLGREYVERQRLENIVGDEHAPEWYKKWSTKHIISPAASFIVRRRKSVGCSSGVSALQGLNCMILIEQLLTLCAGCDSQRQKTGSIWSARRVGQILRRTFIVCAHLQDFANDLNKMTSPQSMTVGHFDHYD